MAEVVQYNIEKLVHLITSVEELGIFTREENRTIINKLKAFEYDIQKPRKTKHDYLKYIGYLQVLITLLRKRKRRCSNPARYKEVERGLGEHVRKQFRNVVYRYQKDVKLWLTYIDFCKKMQLYEDVGKIYQRMLQVHPDKEDIWIAAAKTQFEDEHSPSICRSLLQRGLRHLPDSVNLWKEYFRMELMFSDLVRKRRMVLRKELDPSTFTNLANVDLPDDSNDAVLSGKIAWIVFKNALTHFSKNLRQVTGFLDILDEFEPDLRTPLKKQIVDLMKNSYPDREETVDVEARCYMDKHFARKYHPSAEDKPDQAHEKGKKFQFASQIYQNGVERIPTVRMWNFFIEFNLEYLSKASNEKSRDDRLENLLTLMENCWNKGLMSRHVFIEWILLLQIKQYALKIDELMVQGCAKWGKHADIWYLRLSTMAKKGISFKEEVKRIFTKAIREIDYSLEGDEEIPDQDGGALRSRSMDSKSIQDVWCFYIDWASKHSHPSEVINKIEKHFLECLDRGDSLVVQRKLSAMLKPLLLKKCIQLKSDGINCARQYYQKYKAHPPVTEAFFQEMIDIESQQIPLQYDKVKLVFEDFVTHFGSSNHQIWLEYCKFEMNHGKPQNVGIIHYRACKALDPVECDSFVSLYCLLQNEK